jgi:hypothetical protein
MSHTVPNCAPPYGYDVSGINGLLEVDDHEKNIINFILYCRVIGINIVYLNQCIANLRQTNSHKIISFAYYVNTHEYHVNNIGELEKELLFDQISMILNNNGLFYKPNIMWCRNLITQVYLENINRFIELNLNLVTRNDSMYYDAKFIKGVKRKNTEMGEERIEMPYKKIII